MSCCSLFVCFFACLFLPKRRLSTFVEIIAATTNNNTNSNTMKLVSSLLAGAAALSVAATGSSASVAEHVQMHTHSNITTYIIDLDLEPEVRMPTAGFGGCGSSATMRVPANAIFSTHVCIESMGVALCITASNQYGSLLCVFFFVVMVSWCVHHRIATSSCCRSSTRRCGASGTSTLPTTSRCAMGFSSWQTRVVQKTRSSSVRFVRRRGQVNRSSNTA